MHRQSQFSSFEGLPSPLLSLIVFLFLPVLRGAVFL
jgi:hypothetical protein